MGRQIIGSNLIAVTPSDSADLATPGTLYIGSAGNIKVDMLNGDSSVTIPVPQGPFPYEVKRVYSTGTTATSIFVEAGEQ